MDFPTDEHGGAPDGSLRTDPFKPRWLTAVRLLSQKTRGLRRPSTAFCFNGRCGGMT